MEDRDGVGLCISELGDAELLSNTRALIDRSNQVLAALLAHLGEVEARGLHRTRACSSLFAYCVYELRLSEDEAVRRVAAARLVRRFPGLLEAVAAGELHLTALLLLGPHLRVGPEELSAPARTIGPLRYRVQFSTTEEYVDLMERAAALLSNRNEPNGIEEIHLQALRLFVE